MTAIPRKLSQWFDKLDLTYAVRNLTRDFANGFLVAEIISRVYEGDVDIYQYYNGLRMEKRQDNWERIEKILKKRGFTISRGDWEPIMHRAKGASLEFLKRLYAFVTGDDKPIETSTKQREYTPYYMKPTATLLMRNTELNRIVDDDQRFEEKVDVLKAHYSRSRTEKQSLSRLIC